MRPIDAEPLEEILRSRCAQYSDDYGSLAGAINGCLKRLQAQPTIAPPPNDPLTMEELREMDGEPVWWEDKYKNAGYGIVSISEFDKVIYIVTVNGTFVAIAHGEMNKHLGLTLFRRKPEAGTT